MRTVQPTIKLNNVIVPYYSFIRWIRGQVKEAEDKSFELRVLAAKSNNDKALKQEEADRNQALTTIWNLAVSKGAREEDLNRFFPEFQQLVV